MSNAEPPAQPDWLYMVKMLEEIKNFQAEEAASMQLELRNLSSELRSVRLCQEKLLETQLQAGKDSSTLPHSTPRSDQEHLELVDMPTTLGNEFMGIGVSTERKPSIHNGKSESKKASTRVFDQPFKYRPRITEGDPSDSEVPKTYRIHFAAEFSQHLCKSRNSRASHYAHKNQSDVHYNLVTVVF